MDGSRRTVIGIMPEGFEFMDDHIDLWVPIMIDPSSLNSETVVNHNRVAIARLKAGETVARADSDLSTVVQNLRQKYPGHVEAGDRARITPLREEMVGTIRPALLLLLGAVGFVLLIACVNVANLLLAKGEARQKEVAIRSALGASLFRNIRLLLGESVTLAILGGTIGLLLAVWGLDALQGIVPEHGPRLAGIRIDKQVLIFTFLLSTLSGVLFGLLPAFQISRTDVQTSLRETTRSATAGLKGSRVRQLLVISEIALAVVLVIGAGLMIKSLHQLKNVSPGFSPQNVLLIPLDLPHARYARTEDAAQFHEQLLQRIMSIPSVRSAAVSVYAPLLNMHSDWYFEIEGRTDEEGSTAFYNLVSPDYFKTLEIPLLKGRLFSKQDQERAEGAVLISETMARRFWKDQDPLGKRINVSLGGPIWREIVGVVGDVKGTSLGSDAGPQMYFPLIDVPFSGIRSVSVVVRTSSMPMSLAKSIKAEIQSLDGSLPVDRFQAMEEVVSGSVSHPRFAVIMLSLFASMALILAAVGIYGVMSYSVAIRTHELGVRMALGARKNEILKLVIRQGMLLSLTGLGIGIMGAIVLTRVMSSLLFEVSATDPATFVLITLLLGIVALVASYVPARRAAKVDPMIALRYE